MRAVRFSTPLLLATALLALMARPAHAEPLPGFKLEGDRWTYQDDKLKMRGILMKPPGKGPFPAILISHGLGGSAQGFGLPKALDLVQWGLVCIAPDYTHTERNPAKQGAAGAGGLGASEENIRRAVKCLDILESLPYVDKKRLGAYGHSMGGFVTIALAATVPDRLMVAAVTGSGVAPTSGYPAPSVQLAEKIRTPFLMMHGSLDQVVPPDLSVRLKQVLDRNKVPNQRELLVGEGHNIDRTNTDEVYEYLRKWFRAHGLLKG